LGAAASIIQQIHTAADWSSIKQAQYEAKIKDISNPVLVVTGATQGFDRGLFWIQFYSYNVDSLLIVFWYVLPLSCVPVVREEK